VVVLGGGSVSYDRGTPAALLYMYRTLVCRLSEKTKIQTSKLLKQVVDATRKDTLSNRRTNPPKHTPVVNMHAAAPGGRNAYGSLTPRNMYTAVGRRWHVYTAKPVRNFALRSRSTLATLQCRRTNSRPIPKLQNPKPRTANPETQGLTNMTVFGNLLRQGVDAIESEFHQYGIATPELTRGNCISQFHKFAGELTSKVNSYYLSCSQWLQLPNPTARRRI